MLEEAVNVIRRRGSRTAAMVARELSLSTDTTRGLLKEAVDKGLLRYVKGWFILQGDTNARVQD